MQIEEAEKRLETVLQVSAEADLLKTLPYVGPILSMVMAVEIGKVERFPSAAHLTSYAGLVPRLHSSGGHTRLGQICGDVHQYLKWALSKLETWWSSIRNIWLGDTWCGCINASSARGTTRRRWSQWPDTWPKPLIGF